MIHYLDRKNILHKCKICCKLILLAILLFYILPQLISTLWYYQDIKIREEHLMDRPMRVFAEGILLG